MLRNLIKIELSCVQILPKTGGGISGYVQQKARVLKSRVLKFECKSCLKPCLKCLNDFLYVFLGGQEG